MVLLRLDRRLVLPGLLLALSCTVQSPPADSGTGTAEDAGAVDAGPPSFCATLGLPERALKPGSATFGFGDVAGDFSVRQLDGTTWRLSEQWTGCESYTFINYFRVPPQGLGFVQPADPLWASSAGDLVLTPLNAHFFFVSWESTEEARRARVESMRLTLEAALFPLNLDEAATAAQWRRFHLVLDEGPAIEGSVGAFIRDYTTYAALPGSRVDLGDRGQAPPPAPYAFAIDRRQEWDPVGSLNQFVGGPVALRMASYGPPFFDYKAAVERRVEAETGVRTVVVVDEKQTRERVLTRTVTFPEAAELATFDSLELDVSVTCRERNVFACSEWDRIANIFVCQDDACMQRRELARWITPYWRPGEHRFLWDASPLLPLLGPGGARRIQVETGPTWERATPYDIRVAFRLARKGGARPVAIVPAFTGGTFNAAYNTRTPLSITPPSSIARAEVVVLLSGHGQEMGSNCAEWCDHRHVFRVDGTDLPELRHQGTIGSISGCGPAAARGLPPGQFGNWAPERAYWCPGLPVDTTRLDITSLVQAGRPFSLSYRANFRGTQAPPGGDIALTSYVVFYQ